MFILAPLAAVLASLGWATGIVLAQGPARALGPFEFTRIQVIACSAIMALICTVLGYWRSVDWSHWPAFAASVLFGIVLGNLAMIACLARGGPRRTEVLLSLKAPLVGVMAFIWLGEVPGVADAFGAAVVLAGITLAILSGSNKRSDSDTLRGGLLPVIALGLGATTCMGFGFLALKPALQAGLDPLAASAIRLLGGAFVISVIGLWALRVFQGRSGLTPRLLGATILPGVIGYAISSSLLLYAFAHFDAGIAAVLGSLSPIFVLPILWLKEGIRPPLAALSGAALTVLGTGIIVLA